MKYKPRGNKKKITLLKQVSTAAVSPAIQALSSFTRIRIFIRATPFILMKIVLMQVSCNYHSVFLFCQ